MPTFSTTVAAGSGLDILASAAALASKPLYQGPGVSGDLSAMGPYNPAAMVSSREARRIMELEFVEMAEIVAEEGNLLTACLPGPSRPPTSRSG